MEQLSRPHNSHFTHIVVVISKHVVCTTYSSVFITFHLCDVGVCGWIEFKSDAVYWGVKPLDFSCGSCIPEEFRIYMKFCNVMYIFFS